MNADSVGANGATDNGANSVRKELQRLADPDKARVAQRFFKTGPGEYGEGDVFRGIRVPALRKLARSHSYLPMNEVKKLLVSRFHEDRHVALFILINQYKKANIGKKAVPRKKKAIYNLYLDHTAYINNWDLIDCSAEHIVGAYLLDRDRDILMKLACSDCLWERRIAIMATFHYIKRSDFDLTFLLAETLLNDPEDLIHKAVGWMLREIGNRDQPVEEAFLRKHYRSMPRTMLRYAIERFEKTKRQAYLKGTVV